MTEGAGPSVTARDDLAGVVDLFGWLTREELSRAVSELAFKRRAEADTDAIDDAIDVAVAEYALVPAPVEAVSIEGTGDELGEDDDPLAVGPAAFPSLPEGAADLPHILDVPDRTVDRETLSGAVHDRLSSDAVAAITEEDAERLEVLVDVTYDVETWAPVDASAIRERILAELDGE
ncbi:hypothetical protein [Halorubrum sp. F4]|uniref:DUF7109 family protein n=1 Tax=Halorubrum sp. F4 TaxID=2989715 RepID=UPI0024809BB3|nr:hypothetical protein [Halorubrum sp. F4]